MLRCENSPRSATTARRFGHSVAHGRETGGVTPQGAPGAEEGRKALLSGPMASSFRGHQGVARCFLGAKCRTLVPGTGPDAPWTRRRLETTCRMRVLRVASRAQRRQHPSRALRHSGLVAEGVPNRPCRNRPGRARDAPDRRGAAAGTEPAWEARPGSLKGVMSEPRHEG